MAFLTQVSSPAGIHLHFPASDDHQFYFVQLQKNPLGTPLKLIPPFQNSVLYSWHLEMTAAADSLFPVRPLCILVTLRCFMLACPEFPKYSKPIIEWNFPYYFYKSIPEKLVKCLFQQKVTMHLLIERVSTWEFSLNTKEADGTSQ